MRILHVIASIDPKAGGPVEGVTKIGQELTRLGHTQEVVCMDRAEDDFVKAYPRKVYALGPGSGGAFFYSKALVPWLRLNSRNYDAVIVNGIWQYNGLAAWRALSGTKIPYFVFTHGMLDPWFKRQFPLKHLKKWLYWPWGPFRLLRDAKAVIFTSEEERRLASESFWLYRCNEVVTAYGTSPPPSNSAELAENFLSKYPQLRGKRILLFLSRIHEKKGCDILLKAFAKFAKDDPLIHLVMAGPDETAWVKKLKMQAMELGVEKRILWTGMLLGDDKWGSFYSAEVFCLPSHQENFGIVVAEALACGRAVLISNKVNIWREIESFGAGIVQDDSYSGTVNGIQQWISLSSTERRDMERAAKICFDSLFRIDRVANSLVSILQGAVPPVKSRSL